MFYILIISEEKNEN